MICPGCAHENRAGAKFCEECAAALPRACASCGAELRASAKFCDECGAPVAAGATSTTRTQGAEGAAQRGEAERSPISGARKVVTIVFADLVGSTALHERLDAESVRAFMESYYAAMRFAVDAHGGRVTQVMGDGVKAVFGAPRVAEDDAIRAVRAAVAMQRAFRALAEQQASAVGKTGLRVAVNTGEVIADGESEIIGDPVNVAARLQEQGRDGDVVIGEATQRIVSTLITVVPLGSFALKGRAEPVKAHRVVSLEPPEGIKAAAFVGREHELARLDAVHQAGLVAPRARLAVLLGSPGLGKSRLIDEFARRLGDSATVISAHCDATGGATFAPLAKALRAHFGLDDAASAEALRAALEAALPSDDAERARIAGGVAALLAGTPAAPEESFFVVRRLLGALAAAKPVVLVIDDLHWAEPLLLDLIEHLVRWGAGARLMLLVGARPELRDTRVSLTTPGGPVADVVTLAGLDASAAMRLAASVIGAEDLPTAVAAKLLAASEGNPLFVGELVRMLVEEGALRREGERWTIGAGLAQLEMPPTIHALLAARIERLRPEERSVIEHAAVIGRHFSRSAVAALMPGDVRNLDARIESLWRSELIEPDTGWFLGEPALRFHHVLIRDAAYRRLLKHTRVDLHARHAEWIEARAGEDGAQDETLGWHFEQAHQCLRELGPIDARGRKLGERAAKHLAAAGRRALARDDLPLAASLLGRALDRLDPSDGARADLALDWCEALLSAGDVGPAAGAIDELGRFTGDSERLRAWHTCFAGQRSTLTDPQSLNATALAVAAAAEALAKLGDAAGEAKAHQVHAQALFRLGRVGAGEAALDRALAAARRPGGDRRRANAVLAGAPLAALWGPSPVTRASGRCLDVVRVLRITQDAPAVEAIALSCQGVLEALRGRTDAARRMVASSRKMVEELGIANRLFEADVFAGRIDLLEGDAVAAEGRLRSAYDGQRELGLGVDAAQTAALLARALLAQGRAAEAEALSHESEALAGDGLQAGIAWRGVRAEALARRGEHAAAVALAEAAVEIASATDALLDHADARLALAAALRAAGRNNEASAEERRAIELWEAKGATLLAERARGNATRAEPALRAPRLSEPLTRPVRRRVRANLATENCARLEAVIAARDLEALPGFLAASYESIHHPTGTLMGPEAPLAIWRALLQGQDPALTNEILATLGDSLALVRGVRSSSAQRDGESIDVGAALSEEITLVEVDACGRTTRAETFASRNFGDAVVRLYERYAELVPDETARVRVEGTARTARVMLGQPDLAATGTVVAPDIEFSDLRTVGFGTLHGAEAVLQSIAAMMDLSRDDSARIDDVLVLEPEALVVRWTNRGTHAESGGAFERNLCQLFTFDSAGLLSRWHQFEAEDDAAALARFDELTAPGSMTRPNSQRVRPNAASAAMARFEVAFAARDLEAIEALLAESQTVVDHPNGASYGRAGEIAALRKMLRSRGTRWRRAPIATLGDSLSLDRRFVSGHGAGAGRFDVADYELDSLVISEVDESGRFERLEIFGSEHLGDAIARLYERHAELLLDGPARDRAAATARSVATLAGTFDLARFAAAVDPDIEVADARSVGTGSLHGTEAVLRSMRALLDLSEPGVDWRIDDVFGVSEGALCVRHTSFGAERVGGGAYERNLNEVWAFGQDGLITRWERFDLEHEAEALARFDALATAPDATPPPQQLATGFENAASRALREFTRAWRARDWSAVRATYHGAHAMDDRRKLMRLAISGAAFFTNERVLFDGVPSEWRAELLATRGERLALFRVRFTAQAPDSGPMEVAMLDLVEVDATGKRTGLVVFDLDAEGAAYAELDARWEAGEAALHERASAALRAFRRTIGSRDWSALAALLSPEFGCEDHRKLGFGTLGGAAYVDLIRSLRELSPDVRLQLAHVRTSDRAALLEVAWRGTRDGGAFEIPAALVAALDVLGKFERIDSYEPEQSGSALARFEELGASAAAHDPLRIPPNAATRYEASWEQTFAAEDWDAQRALASADFRFEDRTKRALVGGDVEVWIRSGLYLRSEAGARVESRLLATLGDRIAIHSSVVRGTRSSDEFELVRVRLVEVDAAGKLRAFVLFDAEDRGAVFLEAEERFAAGEATGVGGQAPVAALDSAVAREDWAALRECLTADFEMHDLRTLGFGALARGAHVESMRALAKLGSGVRVEHLRLLAWNRHGRVSVVRTAGLNESGGPFEMLAIAVLITEGDRVARLERYDLADEARALARFEALCAEREARA